MSASPLPWDEARTQRPPWEEAAQARGSAPTAQAPPDRFAQDRAITEAWAQKHPYLGPLARGIVTAGQNAANAITETPGAIYHAVTDPPTLDEAVLDPQQRLIYRMGGKQAMEAGQDYLSGEVTPRGAASVLPEALGTGVGQVAGGAVYGKMGEVAPDVLSAAKPYATAPIRAGARLTEGVANSKLRPFVKVMTPADEALATRVKIPGRDVGLPKAPIPVEPSPVYPGAAEPTATPEQLNPALVSPSRSLPGQNSPEVIRPPAQPIPPRSGLALPPGPEDVPTPQASSPRLVDQVTAYRARSVGDEGIPYTPQSRAQATMSRPEAESYAPYREEATGQPQEVVGVDVSQSPAFSVRPGPRGPNWVKFHGEVPESAISRPRLIEQMGGKAPETIGASSSGESSAAEAYDTGAGPVIQQRPIPGSAEDLAESRSLAEQVRDAADAERRTFASQQKRDWFARNVPGKTKGELTGQTPGPVRYPKAKPPLKVGGEEVPANQNLVKALKDSVRKARQAQEEPEE